MTVVNTHSIHVLRDTPPDTPPPYDGDTAPESTPEAITGENDRPLACKQCLTNITRRDLAMTVDDKHKHVFFNPAGQVFEVGCFAAAKNIKMHGVKTEEFTWFPGYSWQVATCTACNAQLGWRYTNNSSGFFGLILSMLVEKGDDGIRNPSSL